MKKLAGFLSVMVAAGCGAPAAGPGGPGEEAAAVIQRTIVRLGADGTDTVTTATITPAQQEAELQARAGRAARKAQGDVDERAQAITADSGCAGSDLFLFAQADLAGPEICFIGWGVADLGRYCRAYRQTGINPPTFTCVATWAGSVRSYWPGADEGSFQYIGQPPCREDFRAGQGAATAAGACAQQATTLRLGPALRRGSAYAFGSNVYGRLGNGGGPDSAVPVLPATLGTVAAVAVGETSAAALLSDGTVRAWGYNGNGELGNGGGAASSVPVAVANLTRVKALAAGDAHYLALRADGTVWAWGGNWHGELGNGTTAPSPVPVQVQGLTDVVAVAAGYLISVALKGDGSVWTWGDNGAGALGIGTLGGDSHVPVRAAIGGASAISTRGQQVLALAAGAVWGWGKNDVNDLGGGNFARPDPTVLGGLSDVVQVAAGLGHLLALKADGTVWAMGGDTVGQLGNNTTADSSIPVEVVNLSGAAGIGTGDSSSFAIRSDGSAWGWGADESGQLGGGPAGRGVAAPVPIKGPGGAGRLAGVASLTGAGNYGTTLALVLPQAGLSTTSLAFGAVPAGYPSASMPVTLANTGQAPLLLDGAVLGGANAGDFAIDSNSCAGAAIAPGATCTLGVHLTPAAAGARSAVLTLSDNAADPRRTVALSGTGVVASAGANPASVNFGSQALGTGSVSRTVTLTNTGGSPLYISRVAVQGGTGGADFSAGTGTLPLSLAPGASTAVIVRFAPTAAGGRAATLVISANVPNGFLTVPLSGTGIPPADLALSLTADRNPVAHGARLTYTLVVQNLGPGAASVDLRDALPAGAAFVSATPSAGMTCSGSASLDCVLASLPGGGTATLVLVVSVTAARGATLTNTPRVSGGVYDPDPANNQAILTTSVN